MKTDKTSANAVYKKKLRKKTDITKEIGVHTIEHNTHTTWQV